MRIRSLCLITITTPHAHHTTPHHIPPLALSIHPTIATKCRSAYSPVLLYISPCPTCVRAAAVPVQPAFPVDQSIDCLVMATLDLSSLKSYVSGGAASLPCRPSTALLDVQHSLIQQRFVEIPFDVHSSLDSGQGEDTLAVRHPAPVPAAAPRRTPTAPCSLPQPPPTRPPPCRRPVSRLCRRSECRAVVAVLPSGGGLLLVRGGHRPVRPRTQRRAARCESGAEVRDERRGVQEERQHVPRLQRAAEAGRPQLAVHLPAEGAAAATAAAQQQTAQQCGQCEPQRAWRRAAAGDSVGSRCVIQPADRSGNSQMSADNHTAAEHSHVTLALSLTLTLTRSYNCTPAASTVRRCCNCPLAPLLLPPTTTTHHWSMLAGYRATVFCSLCCVVLCCVMLRCQMLVVCARAECVSAGSVWVGVDLDEPVGKHAGSVLGTSRTSQQAVASTARSSSRPTSSAATTQR